MVGGQATSIPLESSKFGAAWMNNGVQGGSPVSLMQQHFILSICLSVHLLRKTHRTVG